MGLILILLIAIVIFIAYHKIMNVWYFSFKAFISEILTILLISTLLAMILISLLGTLLTTIGSILGKVFTVILFIVKWGLIIGGILLIGAFIKSIFFKDKNNTNLDNDLKAEENEIKNNMWAPFKKHIELIMKNKKRLIVVVLCIISLTAIYNNVFSKKGSKEYYIDMVKNMESGVDGYTLEELLNCIFEEYVIAPNIKWDYIEDKQIVSVTISDNDNNSESRYYSVKNGPSNIEEVYIDGSSVNENLSNIVGSVLDEKYSSSEYKYEEDNDREIEDITNETLGLQEDDYNYGSYTANELGNKYSTYAGINTIKDNDIETIKEILLDMNFIGCSNNIGDSLKSYFEDIQFNEYQTEKGVTINISGYSEKLGNNLMLSILATYEGDVYLTEIRQGKSNSMIDISTQLEIADDIFK